MTGLLRPLPACPRSFRRCWWHVIYLVHASNEHLSLLSKRFLAYKFRRQCIFGISFIKLPTVQSNYGIFVIGRQPKFLFILVFWSLTAGQHARKSLGSSWPLDLSKSWFGWFRFISVCSWHLIGTEYIGSNYLYCSLNKFGAQKLVLGEVYRSVNEPFLSPESRPICCYCLLKFFKMLKSLTREI